MRAFWVDAAIWCKNGSKRSILVAINHHQGFLRPAGWVSAVSSKVLQTPRLDVSPSPSIHQSALGEHWNFLVTNYMRKGGRSSPKLVTMPQNFCPATIHMQPISLSDLPSSWCSMSMFLHSPSAMRAFVHQWVSASADLDATLFGCSNLQEKSSFLLLRVSAIQPWQQHPVTLNGLRWKFIKRMNWSLKNSQKQLNIEVLV